MVIFIFYFIYFIFLSHVTLQSAAAGENSRLSLLHQSWTADQLSRSHVERLKVAPSGLENLVFTLINFISHADFEQFDREEHTLT